jgi:hypothetical protein
MSDVDGSTAANISELLKETYSGAVINKQFKDFTQTYERIEKSDRRIAGKKYNFNITYANPMGGGARGDNQLLPSPLTGKYDQGNIRPTFNYHRLRHTGPAIEASKGDAAAFMEAMGGEVEMALNALAVDLNRQCHSDGFGAMATLSEDSDALSTSATWEATCDNDVGLAQLQEGMVVDFYTAGGAIDQSATSSRILSLNPATKVITFEANDGTYKADHPIVAARSYTIATDAVPSGSIIVRQGARAAVHATTNDPIEITGLDGLYDDGTLLASFEGVTVADFPKWSANVLRNSGVNRELTVTLMLQAIQRTRIASGMRISTIRMGLGQQRKYFDLLAPDVRYVPTEFKGGYEMLTFHAGDGAIEILVDPAQKPNKIYFEPKSIVKKYETKPLGWIDADQRLHQRADFDAYDQALCIYTNLGVENRNCLSLLTDLTEPPLY